MHTLGVTGFFLVGTFTNQGSRAIQRFPQARSGFPLPQGRLAVRGFLRGVFAVGLPCPPSRPLVRSAGSVCNGMLPARAYGSRSLLTGLLVPPRHASARDSSGQAPCPPGFRSGQGCFSRVRAPAVTGLRGKPEKPCPQWGFALRGAWQVGFWRQRAGFLACAWGWPSPGCGWGDVFRQEGSPLITRQRSNGKQRCSPTGCGVSSAQQCVQLTSLRSRVRGRDFQIQVVVPARESDVAARQLTLTLAG